MDMQSFETEEEDEELPERPGEGDCSYYMKNGICGFGSQCRYNHPPNRRKNGLEYLDSDSQPACQYYLNTGSCKYGVSCKYRHPKEEAGSMRRTLLNLQGLPLRLGEKDCMYYMQNGICKYGAICKFHHPEPATSGDLVCESESGIQSSRNQSVITFPHALSSGVPAHLQVRMPIYNGSPRYAMPSFYPLVLLPSGMMPTAGWNPYQVSVAKNLDYAGQLQSNVDVYGMRSAAMCQAYQPGSAIGLPLSQFQSLSMQTKVSFPERPGQLECQYFVKTGDCKFGMICRFHHPKERSISQVLNLNPMGLPLRPGSPLCMFYSRYGVCKFGPVCKFDHPIGLNYIKPASPTFLKNTLPTTLPHIKTSLNTEIPPAKKYANLPVEQSSIQVDTGKEANSTSSSSKQA